MYQNAFLKYPTLLKKKDFRFLRNKKKIFKETDPFKNKKFC